MEDEQPPVPPQPEPEPELDFVGADEFSVQSDSKDEPMTPMTANRDEAPWHTHGPTSKNAWDDVAGIESYVRALTASQRKRGQVQVLQHDAAAQPQQTHILSPTNEPSADELIEKVKERRESLILTDFPTAIERPSLPVTPAPIRRNTFWGGQRDSEGELPPAEGVPDQSDWVSIFNIFFCFCDANLVTLGPIRVTGAASPQLSPRAWRPQITINTGDSRSTYAEDVSDDTGRSAQSASRCHKQRWRPCIGKFGRCDREQTCQRAAHF